MTATSAKQTMLLIRRLESDGRFEAIELAIKLRGIVETLERWHVEPPDGEKRLRTVKELLDLGREAERLLEGKR